MLKEKTPKVSVCVVTYNQEKYIRQCLQSIVDQKTDFDFEVIVGDDCSTDGTRAIVQEFANKYPDMVKPIFHEKNIGGGKNYFCVHKSARGEYIAHVDGDDYCLPGKLQAQANLLNSNPHCNIVWHRMYALTPENILYVDNFSDIGLTLKKYYLGDIICNVTIGLHSSKMYRNLISIERLENTNESDYLDFTINILQLNDTDKYACFVDEAQYGVYRANIGISQQQNSKIKTQNSKQKIWLSLFWRTVGLRLRNKLKNF